MALWSSCWGGCACQEGKSPTRSTGGMVLHCALWLFLYFSLCIAVLSLTLEQWEDGALWSAGVKDAREHSLTGTHRSKSYSQLHRCGGEQLHKALGRAETIGSFAQLKGFLSRAITVSASLSSIQEQAIFIWITAGLAVSSNGKTCQAPWQSFPALVRPYVA